MYPAKRPQRIEQNVLGFDCKIRDAQRHVVATRTPNRADGTCGQPDPAPASQTERAASRDGVEPKLAELNLHLRSKRQASIATDQGAWRISRPTDYVTRVLTGGSCKLGSICSLEYGEVLLMRKGKVVKAYPMHGVPPKWIYATDDAVYTGAVGDGALPMSTLVRIDRRTLQARTITLDQDDPRLAFIGIPSGVEVTSMIGPLRVDIDAVARSFASS